MKYQLLIFDWDGTLMDSEAQIVSCMEAACRDLQIRPPQRAAIRNIIGLGLYEAIAALLPEHDAGTWRRIEERYRHHFLLDPPAPAELFPGARRMLQDLHRRGHWLAVATGKGRAGLRKVLVDTNLQGLFHATRCAGDTASKPNPQMLFELLDETGLEPSRALMIGDTEYDLQMARSANMAALAVSYGVHERERLLQFDPVGCVDSVSQLHNWF